MTNYKTADAANVYRWMREGDTEHRAIKWPGKWARAKHALPTSEDDCSEWQGYFRRRFLASGQRAALPAVKAA